MKINAVFGYNEVCCWGFVHNMRRLVDMLASAAYVCVRMCVCVKRTLQLGACRQSAGGEALIVGKS